MKDWRKFFSVSYTHLLLHVYKDTVMLPNGIESGREYIKHVGAVCVVALDGKGNIVVEQQYRYPVGRCLLYTS